MRLARGEPAGTPVGCTCCGCRRFCCCCCCWWVSLCWLDPALGPQCCCCKPADCWQPFSWPWGGGGEASLPSHLRHRERLVRSKHPFRRLDREPAPVPEAGPSALVWNEENEAVPFFRRRRRPFPYSTETAFFFSSCSSSSVLGDHDGDAPGLRHPREIVEVGLGAVRVRDDPRHHHRERARQHG